MKKVILYCAFSPTESSRVLRLTAAADFAGVSVSGFTEEIGQYGKPYFKSHPNVCFSVSHSGNIWVCAFSDTEVGTDVQVYDKTGNTERRRRIANRWFSENEREYLEKCGYGEAEFYKIWARKEAYVKFTGDGIGHGDFSAFDTTQPMENCVMHDIVLPYEEEPHSAAVVCTDEFTIEVRIM